MSLINLFGRKNELLAIQNLVTKTPCDRLIFSEKQLFNMAKDSIQRDLEIANDCVKIINQTADPDTFFMRLNLLEEKSKRLVSFEQFKKYFSFSIAPSVAYNDFCANKQNAIKQFLIHYYSKISILADNMKTDKGRFNKYKKFYDSLQPYYGQMNTENIDYIETKFRACTRFLHVEKGKNGE